METSRHAADQPVEEFLEQGAAAPEIVEVVEPEREVPEAPEEAGSADEAVAPEPEAEAEGVEAAVEPEAAPRTRRGRKAKAVEVTEPEATEEVGPEADPEAAAEDDVEEAEEQPAEEVAAPAETTRETPHAPRGPKAWLGALAARGAQRQAQRQEARRLDEVARAHAEAERELAREAATQLPAEHTPAELRDKIASIRQERAVAAQKAEDLAAADRLEAEASRDFAAASERVRLYDISRQTFEQASYIVQNAQAQMESARQGYYGLMDHATELKRQADALRAAYAEPEAEPVPLAA